MTATLKVSLVRLNAVNEMPSTVTEPFSTMRCMYSRGMRTTKSGAGATTWPTASTCPSTMCPPSRSPSAIGRSRLTGSPACNEPKLVREYVSSLTSASHHDVPSVATTVRQQPLTAMEAPRPEPCSTRFASMRRREPLRSATLPSSSTIPVNTAVHTTYIDRG